MRTMRLVPRDTRPARIEALSLLPVFMDLRGRRVVIAGNPEPAAWKAELAAAAGADVDVFTLEHTDDLAGLSAHPPAGRIHLVPRAWMPDDLDGAMLAIGALDGDEAADFAAVARLRGVPVNIVDNPQLSTVSFGAIVNRSPIVVAISTDGAAPVLGQTIRARIETMLHPAIAAWAVAAKALRTTIKARVAMGAARRLAWSDFAALALAARRVPDEDDIEALVAGAIERGGSIAIVGAGPGDPELLTIKALRALQSADVVLYDRLVAPEILELARREARRMLIGKPGGGAACNQDDICQLMVALAKSGKRVVRLEAGDPSVFGRLAEQLDAAAREAIPVEVVPGITAAIGAAAALRMPLTDRRSAKRLQIVTGHGENGRAPVHDWARLADPEATTVYYMSTRTFAGMAEELMAAGCAAELPAVIIWSATTPRARSIATTVAGIAEAATQGTPGEPCLIIVGEVARRAAAAPNVGDGTVVAYPRDALIRT